MDKVNKITIEYCTAWGYLGKVVTLTENILSEHRRKIGELLLLPSSDGVFEVTMDGKLLFSNKKLDRFPDQYEVEGMVRSNLKEVGEKVELPY